jgi:hypothetical protein
VLFDCPVAYLLMGHEVGFEAGFGQCGLLNDNLEEHRGDVDPIPKAVVFAP